MPGADRRGRGNSERASDTTRLCRSSGVARCWLLVACGVRPRRNATGNRQRANQQRNYLNMP
jgi:hypothetical protein